MTEIDELLEGTWVPPTTVTEVTNESVSEAAGPESDNSGGETSPAPEATVTTDEPVVVDDVLPAGDDAPSGDSVPNPTDAILDALMARIHVVETKVDPLRMMLYGPPGVGKTVLACAAPGALLVDVERGSRSLKNHPQLSKVRVLEFTSIRQLELLVQYIKAGKIEGLTNTDGTLVIDSGTEVQKRDLDDVLALVSANEPARNRFIPTGPDYNANTEHMRMLLGGLRDLPCNVVMTAHVREVKVESTGVIMTRPNFTDKLAGTLNHAFDTVGYLTLDGETRKLQVHPSRDVVAKTRIGGLPIVIENPRMHDIVEANKATPSN